MKHRKIYLNNINGVFLLDSAETKTPMLCASKIIIADKHDSNCGGNSLKNLFTATERKNDTSQR